MFNRFLMNLVNSFLPEDAVLNFFNNDFSKPLIITDDFSNYKANKIFCSYNLNHENYIMILNWNTNEWYIKDVIKISNYSNNFRDKTSSIIISECYGDVDGDGLIDKVYLTGSAPFNNTKNYISDITLIVEYGNKKTSTVTLKNNSGYNPKVNLYSFIKNTKKEILISIIPGGSDNSIFYYIYSFIDNSLKNIFDFETYNNESFKKYSVLYEPNYNLKITNLFLNKKYLVNLSLNDKDYLSLLYNADGSLKDNFKGSISNLVGLYPINLENNDIFQLLSIQNVIGIVTQDIIASIQVYLNFKDDSFKILNESVSIEGFYVH